MQKKIITIFLFIVIVSITACGKKKDDVTQTNDVNDSKENVYYTEILETDSYIDENIEETYEFAISDKKYVGDYKITQENFSKDITDFYFYTGDTTSENQDGCVGIVKGREAKANIYKVIIINPSYYGIEIKEFSDNEAAALAIENFAKKYIDTEEYLLNISLKDNDYMYEYNRYIDGVRCEESFLVSYSKDADCIEFAAAHIGKYKDVSLGELDEKKAEELALNRIREMYGDDKEYHIENKYISTIDGNIGIVYTCSSEDFSYNELVFVCLK